MALENKLRVGDIFYFVSPETRHIIFDETYVFLGMCPVSDPKDECGLFERGVRYRGTQRIDGDIERINIHWMVQKFDEPKKGNGA